MNQSLQNRSLINTPNQVSSTLLATSNITTVRVLIYNGYDALSGSVNGIINTLNYANSYNSVPNVRFVYTTTKIINWSILSSYKVLIMPGGTSGYSYLKNSNINGTAIKKFVSNGGGYVGICAGSYAALHQVIGYYYGWGLAPDVNGRAVSYVGKLNVSMTTNGTKILQYSGNQTVYHWNGPAMYEIGTANRLAKYSDNKTGYKNYGAIETDNYGSGRVVLSGPHPELSPSKPRMLARMITYSAKITNRT